MARTGRDGKAVAPIDPSGFVATGSTLTTSGALVLRVDHDLRDDAPAEWRRLRHAGRGGPVVVGGDEDPERLAEWFRIKDPAAFGFRRTGPSRVHILLVPATASWEVPAYFRWGDRNACPPPDCRVAASRAWQDRFGVDLAGIDGDTTNLVASRRPASRDEARSLARDVDGYRPVIVDRGVGALSALAAMPMTSKWRHL